MDGMQSILWPVGKKLMNLIDFQLPLRRISIKLLIRSSFRISGREIKEGKEGGEVDLLGKLTRDLSAENSIMTPRPRGNCSFSQVPTEEKEKEEEEEDYEDRPPNKSGIILLGLLQFGLFSLSCCCCCCTGSRMRMTIIIITSSGRGITSWAVIA